MARETAQERRQRQAMQLLAALIFDHEAHQRIMSDEPPQDAPAIGSIVESEKGNLRVWAIARDVYVPRWVVVAGDPDRRPPGQPIEPSIQVRDADTNELVTAYQEVNQKWWIGHHRESQQGISLGWVFEFRYA